MLWIGTMVALLGTTVVLTVAAFLKRRPDIDQLGSVSSHWVSEHRIDDV